MPGVPFVGLTGGLGAGKSAALDALARLGSATLSADAVVHELIASDEVRDLLVQRFGPDVAPGGTVDRSVVATRVFRDDEQRGWLESVLWPRVGMRMATWRQEVEKMDPPPPAAVIEVPLLFESGMESAFDKTIVVVADEAVRAERAAARGHELVDARAARQLSQDEKALRADIVVHNDGDLAGLEEKLAEVLARL